MLLLRPAATDLRGGGHVAVPRLYLVRLEDLSWRAHAADILRVLVAARQVDLEPWDHAYDRAVAVVVELDHLAQIVLVQRERGEEREV